MEVFLQIYPATELSGKRYHAYSENVFINRHGDGTGITLQVLRDFWGRRLPTNHARSLSMNFGSLYSWLYQMQECEIECETFNTG